MVDEPLRPTPQVGDLVDRTYTLTALLGSGGMGLVFRAVHVHTGRTVAVKVMRPELAHDPAFQRRFEAEAKAIGALRHPNVVDISDFGYGGDGAGRFPYLVMELLEGYPLSRLVGQDRGLPWSWLASILEQVCRGVDVAHAAGVVHADLKPENIWLTPRATGGFDVKVVDFGLAQSATAGSTTDASTDPVTLIPTGDWLTDARTTVTPRPVAGAHSTFGGTPRFMSPERLLGAAPSPASDIYSLGVLAYCVATSTHPAAAAIEGRLFEQMTTRCPDMPAHARVAIAAALAPAAGDRPRTARAFAAALRTPPTSAAPEPQQSAVPTRASGLRSLFRALPAGFRLAWRAPALAGTAALILALGIGATTAMYTVVKAVLLDALPFPDAQRIVQVWRSELPQLTYGSASFPRYLDWSAAQRPFSELGAWSPQGLTLGASEGPERVSGGVASAAFFRVVGAPPAVGRWFTDDDDRPGAPRVAVLSHGLWTRRFRGTPDVLGTTVELDGEPYTVVGVAPAALSEVWRPEVWVPLGQRADAANRRNNYLMVFGRLRDGVSLATARQELAALADTMARAHPEDRYSFTARDLHDVVTESTRRGLLALLAATAFLLGIGCTNVANLLLARTVTREREFAVRTALGARRSELVGQVLGETMALGALGSIGGAALAWLLVSAFVAALPATFPRLAAIGLDAWALGASVAIAVGASLAAGLVPALHLLKADLHGTVRQSGDRGATSARARVVSRGLVVAQVSLALALLTCAGLMAKSLLRLGAQDLGLTPEPVLTFSVSLPPAVAEGDAAIVRFHTEWLARLRGVPGVTTASAINMLPIANTGTNGPVRRPEQLGDRDGVPVTELRVVADGYADAMGLRLLAGRALDARDSASAPPVVLVNEALARQLWPERTAASVVGQQIKAPWDKDGVLREVVGVMADVRSRRPDARPDPEIHGPLGQLPSASMTYVVRGAGDPTALTASIRTELAAIAPRVALANVRTFGAVVASAMQTPRLLTRLSVLFGGLATLLAVLGLYAVLSCTVAQRSRELAIRAAIGASPRMLVTHVAREGLGMTLAGVLLGLVLARAASAGLTSLLYDVSTSDAGVFAASALGLAMAAGVGYALPARRASQVEPVYALRAE